MAERIVKCVICDKEFVTLHARQCTCGEECKKEHYRNLARINRQRLREESKARMTSCESQQESIDTVTLATLAKKAGMSYGQYVAKYGL